MSSTNTVDYLQGLPHAKGVLHYCFTSTRSYMRPRRQWIILFELHLLIEFMVLRTTLLDFRWCRSRKPQLIRFQRPYRLRHSKFHDDYVSLGGFYYHPSGIIIFKRHEHVIWYYVTHFCKMKEGRHCIQLSEDAFPKSPSNILYLQ